MPLQAATTPIFTGIHGSFRIGTWNIRTLNADSKPEQLIQCLADYKVDICCLSEVRWPGTGSKKINGWQIVFSGRDDGLKRQGVGIAVSPRAAAAICDTCAVSEGVILLKCQLRKHILAVISAYSPTLDYPEDQKDEFNMQLQNAVDQVASRDVLIIGGDFNAQLGAEDCSVWHGALGPFALKRDNLRTSDLGTRLLDFCIANELVVRNTFFDHKDVHLATWVSPCGGYTIKLISC